MLPQSLMLLVSVTNNSETDNVIETIEATNTTDVIAAIDITDATHCLSTNAPATNDTLGDYTTRCFCCCYKT